MSTLASFIKKAETLPVPDPVRRGVINALCAKQSRELQALPEDSDGAFVLDMARRAIAEHADAANRQRGTPSDARLVVPEQADDVGWRRRRGDCGCLASNNHRWSGCDGGCVVAQHALILESEDPGHLLFEGGTGRLHRRDSRRRACTR